MTAAPCLFPHWSCRNPGNSTEGEEALSTLNIEVTPTDIFNSTPVRTNVIHTHSPHLRKFAKSCPCIFEINKERSKVESGVYK